MAKKDFDVTDLSGFGDMDVASKEQPEPTVKTSVVLPKSINKKLKMLAVEQETSVQKLLLQAARDLVEHR